MIDMVFLLLVFFMTVSTLAKDSRPELELAHSRTASIPESAPPKDIITITQENGDYTYFWRNQKMDRRKLHEQIRSRPLDAGEQLVLRGGPDLPWVVWKGLISICREADIADVVFATFEE